MKCFLLNFSLFLVTFLYNIILLKMKYNYQYDTILRYIMY